jgi:predicted metal-binding protein
MGDERIRPVSRERPADVLWKDAERYAALALERGASGARAVAADEVPVDERVAVKCSVPKCFGYGTSANCPPHSMRPRETRDLLSRYRCGVVFKLEVAPEIIVRDRATIEQRVAAYKKVFEISGALESASFYDGYYLSAGFAAGSCKSTYCHDKPCAVLGGDKCRFALRARPSMEAVGIDCYRLATGLGWEVFPIGSDAKAGCVARGTLMGLILVD